MDCFKLCALEVGTGGSLGLTGQVASQPLIAGKFQDRERHCQDKKSQAWHMPLIVTLEAEAGR